LSTRYKALPPAIRGAPRSFPPNPAKTNPRPDRLRDWLAVLPMILLIPALLYALNQTEARGSTLAVSGQAVPGQPITVVGSNLRPNSDLQVLWDGLAKDMPRSRSTKQGSVTVTVVVPQDAPLGEHEIGVAEFGKRRNERNAPRVVATVNVIVESASPSETPSEATATVMPTQKPTPTAQETTPAVSATPIPSPTAEPSSSQVPGSSDDLYVSPLGSDANPGSIGSPLRTIGLAIRRLQPGQTLYVRGGSYVENIRSPSINSGTPSARITIRNYPGERPVLQGLLWLSGASYWTVNGINVTWNPSNSESDHMVKMTNGVGWIFENSEVWGARSVSGLFVAGTTIGQPANWVVRGNCVHDTWPTNDTNQDHNMYVNTGISAGAGLIEHNLFFNAPNGENVKLGGPTAASYAGSANIVVRNNTLHNAYQPILLAGGTHDITIEGNIIDDSARDWLVRGFQLVGIGNVVRNNLGYGATRLIYDDPGFLNITDAGGNVFPHDPEFDGTGSCNAFHPTDGTAQSFGR
jgi:hypothetical protein